MRPNSDGDGKKTSLSFCADMCRRNAGCKAFSFTIWRECFLKHGVSEEEESIGGSISGICDRNL